MSFPRSLPSTLLFVLAVALSIAAFRLDAAEPVPAADPAPAKSPGNASSLPEARQGKFPVHMPRYEGVDQLLLLSSRWIVVVTNNIDEVYRQIDRLSGGKLFEAIRLWEESSAQGKPNWTAYKGRGTIRDQFLAEARELAGERKLDDASYYRITSDGPGYGDGLAPLRVTRVLVGLGENVGPAEGKLRGVMPVYYAHYSYLEMPKPLENGRQYTVALADGRKVTFLYDEMRTVSRAIKVNQVGYLPGARQKFAYLGACLHELGPHDFSFVDRFQVISAATGEAVFEGKVRLREKNPRFAVPPGRNEDPAKRPLIAGEDVYEMDLGGLTAVGDFFITIPGVGRSWTFRHAPDAYGEAFFIAARGLYHQRCGTALQRPYTAWTRKVCHTDPIYECGHIPWAPGADFKVPKEYQIFDVIGATTDTSHSTPQPRGGWHDAADWDRNISHYACLLDLLNAYELAPRKFTDGQLHLPESGNGIPDLLDEAEYGLEVWKRSITPEGAVSGMVETWTHPRVDDPEVKYSYSRRTRWSSLLFAATAAQYAQLVRPFDGKRSQEYRELAERAYRFGADPAHSLGKVTIEARRNRGKGEAYTMAWEETDAMVRPYLVHAKARLYLLTGDEAYLADISKLADDALAPYQWPNRFQDFSAWLYFDLAYRLNDKLPAGTVAKWKDFFVSKAAERAAMNDAMPYRVSWPRHQDYWMGWGASTMTNVSRAQLIGHALSRDPKLREAAIQNADFMLGDNPLGMSWTSGLGCVYPIDFQHANSENDGIMDPVPGITLYGTTGGVYRELRELVWRAPSRQAPGGQVDFMSKENMNLPIFRAFSCHPRLSTAQCEFTIHETCSSSILTFALLIPDGWMPDEELKARQPRAEPYLFGYYYLP
jgi:endoglucanase